MRHKNGLFLPNGQTNIYKWTNIVGNGTYVLLHHYVNWLGKIKEICPEALLTVRFYLPDWPAINPQEWANTCARIYKKDVKPYTNYVFLANEQNLGHESNGIIGATESKRATANDYHIINDWNVVCISEFKKLCPDAKVGYPPFALGHSDDNNDYGFVGYEICRPGVELADFICTNIYWSVNHSVTDPWLGLKRIEKTENLSQIKTLL